METTKFNHPQDIQVGVLGYGGAFNMGKKHLEEMQRAGMSPIAVAEVDKDRLEVAKQDFADIETYDSLEKMLKGSEVNLIAHITPHHLHYPLARKCVKAGRHVVTEKPFVINTTQADKLIEEAANQNVMVSTYHNRHWDGWIMRAAHEIVDKNIIGDVYKVRAQMGGRGMPKAWWRRSKSTSGGILYDWGVHLLEYSLQIIQSQMVEVSGYANYGYWASQLEDDAPWKDDLNEDEARAVVRFENGAYIDLCVSQLETDSWDYQIGFFGTKGCYLIKFGGGGWTTRIVDDQGELQEQTGEHPEGEGHLFYKNIAEHLTGQADLIITPEWARRPIHILDLADKSAKRGRAVKAKYG